MTTNPFHGVAPGFWCVRCGEEYIAGHPVHPEDGGNSPTLSRLRDLPRRQALMRGEYDRPCPRCTAGPTSWCDDAGTSLLEMHPERATP